MLSLQNLLCYQVLQSFTNIITIACILNNLTALWHLHWNSRKPTLHHVCSMCYSACLRKILVGPWNSHANTLTSRGSCVYSCYSFIPRPFLASILNSLQYPTACFLSTVEKKRTISLLLHYKFYFKLSKGFAERLLHVCMHHGTRSCILSSLSALFAFYHGKYSLQETLC